jgi:hypothetical protein
MIPLSKKQNNIGKDEVRAQLLVAAPSLKI